MKTLAIVVAVIAAAVGGIVLWKPWNNGEEDVQYRTASIERGTLTSTVSATGTLQAENVTDVGAQVTGKIVEFGKDPRDSSRTVDYGSEVEKGTILARIDDALYAADVKQAKFRVLQAQGQLSQGKSQVESARANVQRAEADLKQMQAKVTAAENEWTRVQRFRGGGAGVVSETEYDTARANAEVARATVGVGQASVAQAKAAVKEAEAAIVRFEGMVAEAEAALEKAEKNLEYCTIRSPVKGVIIDRRVNYEQTLVSNQVASSLFLVAQDLKRMQVWASVNEADFGQIRRGQSVRFSVDGIRDEEFEGTVTQIRLNATSTQNVVTYTVIITFDNSKGLLVPYRTANVTFEVDKRKDVLMVLNSALRWQPRREMVAPEAHGDYDKLMARKASSRGSGAGDARQGVLWVEAGDGLVRPVKVKTGITDGTMTEIITEEMKPEDKVVTGVLQARNGDDATSSPFQTRMANPRRPQQ